MDQRKPRPLDAWLMALAQLFRAVWVIIALAAAIILVAQLTGHRRLMDLLLLCLGEMILFAICAGGIWGSTVFIRATQRQVQSDQTP